MDKIEKNQKKNSPENVKGVFKKMIDDKRAMRSYIQKNGTLKGFKSDSINFAKPL
jgi:hypothetical protein